MKTPMTGITTFVLSVAIAMVLADPCVAQNVDTTGATPAEAVAAALSRSAAAKHAPTETPQSIEEIEASIEELLAQGFWYAHGLSFDAHRLEEAFKTEVPILVDRLRTNRKSEAFVAPIRASSAADGVNASIDTLIDGAVIEANDEVQIRDAEAGSAQRDMAPPLPERDTDEREGDEAFKRSADAIELTWQTIPNDAAEADARALETSAEALRTYADALDSIVELVRAEISSIIGTAKTGTSNDERSD